MAQIKCGKVIKIAIAKLIIILKFPNAPVLLIIKTSDRARAPMIIAELYFESSIKPSRPPKVA